MIKSIKSFYQKTDFPIDNNELVEPELYHSIFYHLAFVFQITKSVPKWSYFVQTILILCGFIGLTMSILGTLYGLQMNNLQVLTEAGLYNVLFLYSILMHWSILTNIAAHRNLLRYIKNEFVYICTEGSKFRSRFFEQQLVTWKLSVWAFILIIGIGVGSISMTPLAILYYEWTRDPNGSEERPLIFPLWSPAFDFQKTPYYEIASVASSFIPLAYSYSCSFHFVVEIIWIRHVMLKADLVIWKLKELTNIIEKNKTNENNRKFIESLFKDIIRHHNSMFVLMNEFAKVYGNLLLFNQELYAFVTCLSAYTSTMKLENSDINIVPVLLFFASVLLCGIPSYFCTMMANKVNSVCEALWNLPLWKTGSYVRPYVVLISMRSQRPLPIKKSGFKMPSLQTFSEKTMSSYSMFNMLRQINQ